MGQRIFLCLSCRPGGGGEVGGCTSTVWATVLETLVAGRGIEQSSSSVLEETGNRLPVGFSGFCWIF